MAAAYFEHRLTATLRSGSLCVIAAAALIFGGGGLDSLSRIWRTCISLEDDVHFLSQLPAFHTVSPEFFDYLREFRFHGECARGERERCLCGRASAASDRASTGSADAETYLLSVIHYETLVASKAGAWCARRVAAAFWSWDAPAHGPEAGVRAARAGRAWGVRATSKRAGRRALRSAFGGHAAHSGHKGFPVSGAAFEALLETFPDTAILWSYLRSAVVRKSRRRWEEGPGCGLTAVTC